MLQAFIVRKKTGVAVTIREIEEEFGLDETGFGARLTTARKSV